MSEVDVSIFFVRVVRPHPRQSNQPENPWRAGHWLNIDQVGFIVAESVDEDIRNATIWVTRAKAEEAMKAASRFDADFEVVEFSPKVPA